MTRLLAPLAGPARPLAATVVLLALVACGDMPLGGPQRTGEDGVRQSGALGCRTGFSTCVPVMMPPAMPEAASLRTIAVTAASGRTDALVAQVETQLSKVRWDEQLFYTLVPASDARREGLLEIASASPQVADSRFNTTRCAPGLKTCKNPSEQRQVACTRRAVNMAATVRLQIVKTGAVATRQVSAAKEASYCEGDAGGLPAAGAMQGELVAELANKVQDAFAVRAEERPIRLMDSASDIVDAERKARFTQAVAFMKAKRLDRACSVFGELSEIERRSVAVMFNAGFCAEARGDWAAANALYRAADALTTKPDDTLLKAIQETNLSASQVRR